MKFKKIRGFGNQYSINERGEVRADERTVQSSAGPIHLKARAVKAAFRDGNDVVRLRRSLSDNRYTQQTVASLKEAVFGSKTPTKQMSLNLEAKTEKIVTKRHAHTSIGASVEHLLGVEAANDRRIESITIKFAA